MSTEVELKLTADTRDAERGIAGFSKQYSALVRELSRPLGRVNAFRVLETSLEAAGRESQKARERVRELANEMARTTNPSKQLTASYTDSIKELQKLERQEKAQTAQLARMRAELKGAGIDTRNLAGEQARLQRELATRMGRSDRAGAIESARQNLGLVAYGEAQAKVGQLQRDLQLLQSTGKLTAGELAVVGGTLTSAMTAASGNVRQANAATVTWTESLRNVRGELLAGGIAFGALGLAGKRSFDEYSGFTQRMAEIGTITNESQEDMDQLGVAVRKVSREMGEAASGGAAALYDIISSGVGVDDSVKVLELAGKAAVAGLTDTQTAAKLGLSVINAYGEGVDQLETRYDQLFLAVKNGVTTFPQLAGAIGQVLPTAAAANVSFGEVTAALALMTKQGINTNGATTALRSAINNLAAPAPEAKKNLEAMGITWNGLSDTLRQISEQNLGIAALRQIIPDTEARTAVLALTKDIGGLQVMVREMGKAASTMQTAYEGMENTPEQQIKRFTAAVNDLQISFGQAVGAGLPVINLITQMLNAFNELPETIRTTVAAMVILGAGGKALSVVMKGLNGPFSSFLGNLRATPAAGAAAAAGMTTAAGGASLLATALSRLVGIGLITWTATNLAALEKLRQEMKTLTQSAEKQQQALQELVGKYSGYAETMVLSGTEVEKLTEIERNAYIDRLKSAQTYYKALAEQISRADLERDGASAPVSPEALNAARQARTYREAVASVQTELQQREDVEREHAATVQGIQQEELVSIKTELAKQLQAYDDAATELDTKLTNVAKLREESQKRFQDLADSFSKPTDTGPATFGDVTEAKSDARSALAAGDTDKALAQADRAAQLLEELRDAGANTYGFAGIAKELGQIADEALKLDATNAQEAFDAQKAKVDQLVQTAKALETIKVGYTSDEESAEQAKARILALATEWAKYMEVPVTYVVPEAPDLKRVDAALGASPAPTGFASGGFTGVGRKYDVAGLVRRGEYVQPMSVMRQPGAIQFMEQFRQHGMNLLKGYADGGLVINRMLPVIPAMPLTAAATRSGSASGVPVNINLDGSTYTLRGESDVIDKLYRLARTRKLQGRVL